MSVEAAVKALATSGITLPVSAPTLRRYIDQSRSSLIRLDLLSAPGRRPRKKSVPRVSRHLDDGRSFTDFQALSENLKGDAWEMDTVQGSKRDRCRLLTLCHRTSGALLIFKIGANTAESVVGILDYLQDLLREAAIDFDSVFGVILTDNGTEFSDVARIERSDGGSVRCALYYCDPYSSWQKPHVENAHTLIRRIVPKGLSFEGLTHDQIALICSHVNSYPRPSREHTPFERMHALVGHRTLSELGVVAVEATAVILSPRLLDF
jgi:IS30 family transposase